MLQKKLTTDDVALNLTLKPDFRDRWLCNLEGSAGVGSHPLWQAAGNALQIGRGSQSAYLYKGNNAGEEIAGEQALLAASVQDEVRRPEPSGFIPQPSFAAPLKEERLLFNQAHTLSANRLYKLSETTLLRLNANYAHDLARQTRGSRTSYYRTSDTLHIGQQSETHLRSDNANLSLNLESNADRRYLTNRLDLSGNWQQSLTHFVAPTPVRQQIETPLLGASNYLRGLWNKEKQTLEVRSLISYHHAPSRRRPVAPRRQPSPVRLLEAQLRLAPLCLCPLSRNGWRSHLPLSLRLPDGLPELHPQRRPPPCRAKAALFPLHRV